MSRFRLPSPLLWARRAPADELSQLSDARRSGTLRLRSASVGTHGSGPDLRPIRPADPQQVSTANGTPYLPRPASSGCSADPGAQGDDCSRRFVGSPLDESARRSSGRHGHSDHGADPHAGPTERGAAVRDRHVYPGLPAGDRRAGHLGVAGRSDVDHVLPWHGVGAAARWTAVGPARPADTDDRRRADLHPRRRRLCVGAVDRIVDRVPSGAGLWRGVAR